MQMKNKKIVVVGTDTGVGKTVLSFLLTHYLWKKNQKVHYIKPFQTGIFDSNNESESDAFFIQKHLPSLTQVATTLFQFRHPLAPYFASLDDHHPLQQEEMNVVREYIREQSLLYTHLVIEGAGGVFVPITSDKLFIDLLHEWGEDESEGEGEKKMSVLIAARPYLGTINHTLLTVRALQDRGITPAGVVFLHSQSPSTVECSSKDIQENSWAIKHHSGVNVLGTIPYIGNFDHFDNRDTFDFEMYNLESTLFDSILH